MGMLDKVKGLLKGKGPKMKSGVDKVAEVVDKKTGHKYSEKIEDATEKAKDAIDKLEDEDKSPNPDKPGEN